MSAKPSLHLDFHGRFIDALGIQMYQSPTAALAELVANAWDADAEKVEITLPQTLVPGAEIVIVDDGHGMSASDCQAQYLKVGRNRRYAGASTSPKGRPALGRKGIGKFAGFGIAGKIVVDTVSEATGERTVFELDLSKLRSDDFITSGKHLIDVLDYEPPDEARRAKHGTTIRLRKLTMSRAQNPAGFAARMARRFTVAANAQSFCVFVNGINMADADTHTDVQYDFPSDYRTGEAPDGLVVQGSEGVEKIGDDEVRWRIRFAKDTIGDQEFRGVSVFCGIKVAQTPFFFDLSGGLSGQHGQQYLYGYVKADYLDQLSDDIITTERQRINWEHPDAEPLRDWGQTRIEQLLRLWKERRAETRQRQLEQKLLPFTSRLDRLQTTERKTVSAALRKIAGIATLNDGEFSDLATAVLTAWERGRLRDIIDRIANMSEEDAGIILSVLGEAQVLTVLQLAEVIRTKIELVRGLRRRIEEKDLENAIRNYIADNPWLVRPELELYRKETSLKKVLDGIAVDIKLEDNPDFAKRVDLLLAHGDHLVLYEFMRPGITIDRDHIDRFTQYCDEIGARLKVNTGGQFRRFSGYIVADKLERARPGNQAALGRLEKSDLFAVDWPTLLARAESEFRDYFDETVDRAAGDARVENLDKEITDETESSANSP